MGNVKLGWGYLLFPRRTEGLGTDKKTLAKRGHGIALQSCAHAYLKNSLPLFPTLATVNWRPSRPAEAPSGATSHRSFSSSRLASDSVLLTDLCSVKGTIGRPVVDGLRITLVDGFGGVVSLASDTLPPDTFRVVLSYFAPAPWAVVCIDLSCSALRRLVDSLGRNARVDRTATRGGSAASMTHPML